MKTFKQYIVESHEDPDHPKNWSIVKMHKDDTGTGKHRWDIRDKKGEGDVIDSYEKRADAHHYLTKWRKGYTAQNTVAESLIIDKRSHKEDEK